MQYIYFLKLQIHLFSKIALFVIFFQMLGLYSLQNDWSIFPFEIRVRLKFLFHTKNFIVPFF
jgi:hypothetical protein